MRVKGLIIAFFVALFPLSLLAEGSGGNRPAPAPEHEMHGGKQKGQPHGGEHEHDETVSMSEIIFEHVLDSYEWHIIDIGEKSVAIYLPVIVCSKYSGWHVFSSKHIAHGGIYEGFAIAPAGEKHEGKIVEYVMCEGFHRPVDLSITKNVLSLIISSFLLALVVLLAARWYRRHDANEESPKGIAGLMEPIVMMIHDMAKQSIGEDYRRYSPYILMAFFFIFFNNLLGIVPFFPGGANVTGNIAITLTLALCTFFTVNFTGSKVYYEDIFVPKVPVFLKPIMPIIEVFSALMKPVSLAIRLFANMLAGHIQILSIVSIIFILAKYGPALLGSMTLVSVFFGIFLDVLEILISFIQAYVFSMLSAIYIGLARVKEE